MLSLESDLHLPLSRVSHLIPSPRPLRHPQCPRPAVTGGVGSGQLRRPLRICRAAPPSRRETTNDARVAVRRQTTHVSLPAQHSRETVTEERRERRGGARSTNTSVLYVYARCCERSGRVDTPEVAAHCTAGIGGPVTLGARCWDAVRAFSSRLSHRRCSASHWRRLERGGGGSVGVEVT